MTHETAPIPPFLLLIRTENEQFSEITLRSLVKHDGRLSFIVSGIMTWNLEQIILTNLSAAGVNGYKNIESEFFFSKIKKKVESNRKSTKNQ